MTNREQRHPPMDFRTSSSASSSAADNNNLKRSSVVVRRERSERFPVNDCRSVAGSARRGFAGWDARRVAGRAPRCCSGIRSAGVRFICRRMPELVQEESGRGYARDPRTALKLSSTPRGGTVFAPWLGPERDDGVCCSPAEGQDLA